MSAARRHAWIEIAVDAGEEAVEAVSEILDRVGSGGIAVDLPSGDGPHVVKAYFRYDPRARVRVRRVREALGHLQAFDLGPVGEVRVRRIAEEDWLASWKAAFTPIRIGAFHVRPSWSTAPAEAGSIPVVLDPGMAFGTGLHPTTQQCLEALSMLELAGRSLLDVGTGSGILAIAAAKRGARPVVAVDDDPIAVEAARENAAANGVAVDVGAGSAADIRGSFDVVVANIVADVLTRIAPDLRARLAPGGRLVLGGIVAEKEAAALAAFAPLGERERDRRGDWVRVTLA
ncbi:MAG TPA: 50S ribosomal protein L11 methyltransferase [Candidatus Limnocylindria bacterium]|nr:50S ribosomal protein L11 methyltransferase [Candidatus Limnocylindria bacterium]